MNLFTRAVLALELLLALATGYLLLLLVAAVIGKRRRAAAPTGAPLRFAVLVPAHDEEAGIAATIASLNTLAYPEDRREVIVIADNCRDSTAERARAAGVTVWERQDAERRGKGFALAWALERLFTEQPDVDAVAFIDADCLASPNMLDAMDRRLRAGASAVQVDDVVSNPGDSWSSALRYAAFALMNYVRPLGQDTLRVSCGLRGTGMAIRREVLERHPWQAFSVAEDCEYHARLVLAGGRTAFAHEASVRSEMPASLRQARTQHERYETGKWELIRRWAPRLLGAGLRRLDPVRLHTGFEALVPPQALLFAANVLLGIAALVTGYPLALAVAAFNAMGQAVYVVGGLALAGAPGVVWRALLLAPVLVVWKVWLYAGILAGRGSRAWVRGPRQAESGR